MKETIAYKVVSRNWKSFMLDRIENNKPNYYVLPYDLNKKTRCIKNSIGIMCFETIKQTESFYYANSMHRVGIILKVKGVDQIPLTNMCISSNKDTLYNFYDKRIDKEYNPGDWGKSFAHNFFVTEIFPSGTIAFESIIPTNIIRYGF